MKRRIFTVIGLVAVILAAYLIVVSFNSNEPEEIEAQNIKDLVHDYSVGNIANQSASITSEQLIVTDSDESQSAYELPEDEFFVSIAPYVSQTHPCAIHNLTGCQGELVEQEFDVYIEDTEGNVMLDETIQSHANGFIDLWLPRDNTFHVAITQDGKITESEISTYENDNTCITTMQLTDDTSV